MKKNDFNKSIKNVVQLLIENDYIFHIGSIESLNASDEFKKESREGSSYKKLYDLGASKQDFNIMLKDKSYFQFSINSSNDIRLAFYPNPYISLEYQELNLEYKKLLEEGQLSNEDYEQFLSEEKFTNDIPLIRFDFSEKQYCEKYHPTAHFHIGFDRENRWPVRRILSPYAFFLKILMIYYINLWKEWGEKSSELNILDEKYRKELSNCELIKNEYFSKLEEGRLHFR